jgi:hypothetical protein
VILWVLTLPVFSGIWIIFCILGAVWILKVGAHVGVIRWAFARGIMRILSWCTKYVCLGIPLTK